MRKFTKAEPGKYRRIEEWGQIFILDSWPLLSYPLFMARALRIKYKNALYHITSRGNERKKYLKMTMIGNFLLKP